MNLIQFFEWLFEYCEDAQVETRALPGKKQAFHNLGDWASIEKWCKKYQKQNLYFAVATRNGGGTKDHIEQIPAVWCDIDFKNVPQKTAEKRIWEFHLKPSLLIESGGGYHAYWRLKEPASKQDIPLIESINRTIANYFGGDMEPTQAAAILRPPGTINHKPEYNKPIVKVARDNRLIEYNADNFDFLPRPASQRKCANSSEHPILNEYIHIKESNKVVSNTEKVTSNKESQEVTKSNIPPVNFSVGHHDNTLFSISWHLAKGGMEPDNLIKTIEFIAATLDPEKETKRWARAKVKSAFDRLQRGEKSIAEAVREWILETESNWKVTECYRELQLVTKSHKHAARVEIYRLRDAGIVESASNQRGHFRLVNTECDDIDFLSATDNELQVKWPLGIEKLFRLLPGNIVVAAGETDVGKTAFLLNFARLNMHRYEIYYFSSEMGECELKKRLSLFEDVQLEDWKGVKFKDRAGDFQDVIRPDAINIIDFLEIHQDFYLVGKYLKQIHDKLNKGAALVAIQKNPGVEWGLGGHRGMEKARLYLTLCSNFPGGVAKIEKCKNWRHAGDNPKGKEKYFRLYSGCQFSETSEWERPKN